MKKSDIPLVKNARRGGDPGAAALKIAVPFRGEINSNDHDGALVINEKGDILMTTRGSLYFGIPPYIRKQLE